MPQRMKEHEKVTENRQRFPTSCHYRIARKATADNRTAVQLCSWDANYEVPDAVWQMAEQTMIVLLDSHYHLGSVSNDITLKDRWTMIRDQAAYLKSTGDKIRKTLGWQEHLDAETVGCNVENPLFENKRYGYPIYCFKSPYLAPGIRTFTTYKKEVGIHTRPKRNSLFIDIEATPTRTDPTRVRFEFQMQRACFQDFIPKRGIIVFEIMDDHGPHENAWFGCPTVGPFQNYTEASCFAVRVEWLDVPSGEWRTAPIQASQFRRWDIDSLQKVWMSAMGIIQMLEGIVWTEPLNGFKTLSLGTRTVLELTVDHLQQTCHWAPRQAKGPRPAPSLASWNENFHLMANQFGHGSTLVGCDPPTSQELELSHFNHNVNVACDFCKYSKTNRNFYCERDLTRTDIWICKRCSEMNRPCSWTPMSVSLELWGIGPPDLMAKKGSGLASYPTGPHREIAFHPTMSIAQLSTAISIETPFSMDLTLSEGSVEEDEE
ncbi:hypothetical protein FOPG_14558 [Fusarium oxysporum f. sp. conglutinans race 2 54008]|uniref:Uncharacterized protein n=2 Tax=Fusarium oxysporum f. sp. conglutinans TaxID=100902 RepID=F9FZS0_FUSOF|nr:hypothetical protein FOXB_11902 [Fusarium oxysporum f. sp. conglutinans Fo5176]EXL69521.1 hypothetical protein FOPG_14558 [Fusarium oxysporum f. sp. conglutinans race 2 54008]KAG6980504.1 hypothetical protein FocnCong_v009223 [Fusarium oxysporum f. sp. conglutinans]